MRKYLDSVAALSSIGEGALACGQWVQPSVSQHWYSGPQGTATKPMRGHAAWAYIILRKAIHQSTQNQLNLICAV